MSSSLISSLTLISSFHQNLIADEIDEAAFGAVQTRKLQMFEITLSGLAAQILLLVVPNHKDGPHGPGDTICPFP
jgi:hypothetical protein